MKQIVGTVATQTYMDYKTNKVGLSFTIPESLSVSTLLYQIEKSRFIVTSIHSIYVHEPVNSRFYISTPLRTCMVSEEDIFYQKEEALILSYLMTNKEVFITNRILHEPDVINMEINYPEVLSFIFDFSGSEFIEKPVIIVINIYNSWMQEIINSLDPSPEKTFILDADNIPLIKGSTGSALAGISMDKLIEKVVTMDDTEAYLVENIENKKLVITSVTPDFINWTFVKVIPYENIILEFKELRKSSLIIAVLVLISGVLLSVLLSLGIFKPIGGMITRIEELERERSENLFIYKQSALRKLLKDKVKHVSSYVELIFSNFNIKISPSAPLQLILLQIDKYNEFCTKYSSKEQETIKLKIMKTASQVGCGSVSESVDIENDQVVLFLNTEDNSTPLDGRDPFAFCLQLQEYVLRTIGVSFSCSIGRIAKGPQEIQVVYDECRALSHYRMIFGHGSIIDDNMIEEREGKSYNYPDDREKELSQNIRAGRMKEAIAIADQILEKASGYSYTDFTTTLSFIARALNRALGDIKKNTGIQFQHAFSDFIADLGGAETVDEVKSYFHSFLFLIESFMKKKQSNRHASLIEDIKDIVLQEFSDYDLGIESIADQLGMSPAYVGRIFKRITGESLSYYINRLRMKEADRMIKETTLSINEVVSRAGYSNVQHFYSTFKKFHGVTPKEFRKALLHPSDM